MEAGSSDPAGEPIRPDCTLAPPWPEGHKIAGRECARSYLCSREGTTSRMIPSAATSTETAV